jgi:hypothetical protein
MQALKFVLMHAARLTENSLAGSLTTLLASLIPLASVRDGAAGHETDEEKRQRIEHEEHVETQ